MGIGGLVVDGDVRGVQVVLNGFEGVAVERRLQGRGRAAQLEAGLAVDVHRLRLRRSGKKTWM